jgi:hypothetical protein
MKVMSRGFNGVIFELRACHIMAIKVGVAAFNAED